MIPSWVSALSLVDSFDVEKIKNAKESKKRVGDKAKVPYRFYSRLIVGVCSGSSVGLHKLEFDRPTPVDRVGRTREARIIRTHDHFQPVEDSFLRFAILY